jgi:predicted enzyme related to lactoylglutathione lyase
MAKKKNKAAKKAPKIDKKAKKAAAPKKGLKSKVKAAAKKVKAVAKKAADKVRTVTKTVIKTVIQTVPAPAPEPGPGSLVHVEFKTPDLAAAKSFWNTLFGWQMQDFTPTEIYFQPGTWGPGGCIIQGEPSITSYPAFYVGVEDIPVSLARAKDLGASLVKGKTEIPGGHGFYAHLRAPDGNVFGLHSKS